MELKHQKPEHFEQRKKLLIVPYGIETVEGREVEGKTALLIVPYGIETRQGCMEERTLRLLIVPYGIETNHISVASWWYIHF